MNKKISCRKNKNLEAFYFGDRGFILSKELLKKFIAQFEIIVNNR